MVIDKKRLFSPLLIDSTTPDDGEVILIVVEESMYGLGAPEIGKSSPLLVKITLSLQ